MSSQRQLRFSELIRSLISKCFLVEDFYNLNFKITSITISYVKMSKDLRIANVYLMPLGGENKNLIIEELNKQKYIFQKFLSKAKLNAKFTPKIIFFLDDSFDEAEIKPFIIRKGYFDKNPKELNEYREKYVFKLNNKF